MRVPPLEILVLKGSLAGENTFSSGAIAFSYVAALDNKTINNAVDPTA